MPFEYPYVETDNPDEKVHRRRLAEKTHQIMQGKTNNILDVTLEANADSTTVQDARLTSQSALLPMPRTANAAAEIAGGTMYVSDTGRVHEAVTITHANNAQTDRDFYFVIVG